MPRRAVAHRVARSRGRAGDCLPIGACVGSDHISTLCAHRPPAPSPSSTVNRRPPPYPQHPQIRVADDGTVSLRSKTTFPGGKVLELAFAGERVDEAFGLKNVVKFVRTPLEREAEPVEGYYPIVLLVSKAPNVSFVS